MPATSGNQASVERTLEMIKESVKCCAQTAESKAQLQEMIAATHRVIEESLRALVYANEQMRQK